MEYNDEVSLEEAKEIAKLSRKAFVLAENYADLELVAELLGLGEGEATMLEMDDLYPLVMEFGEDEELKAKASKYSNSIIVCPHGNTSLKLVRAIKQLGVGAYSLKGGVAELKKR